MIFSEKILLWYSQNKRELPWRTTNDPYRIWLSEIILQQTRVSQGLPYYKRFIEHFPTVSDLATSSEEQVLKLWQGLGYYSRARNAHITAKYVSEKLNGIFPETYDELIKLKGIGDYTASAIASICFNQPKAVVDGNVFRVLSRYFGVSDPINTGKGLRYFRNLAHEVMNRENIKDYNQAIMEFGAIQCIPVNPKCEQCPLKDGCVAFAEHKVEVLPIKLRKNKVRKRHFNYLVGIDAQNNTQLVQRTNNDIWKRLYEFPLLESHSELDIPDVLPHCKDLLMLREVESVYENNSEPVIHKLSHQHLYTKFWIVKTNDKFDGGIPLDKIEKYPVPVLIADFIKTFKNSYF